MKKRLLLMSLVAAGMLVGCGSTESDDSNTTTSNTEVKTVQGQFVDSPVEGVKYLSKSYEGYTDENGYYLCKSDETVTFYAGDVKLGTTNCVSLVTPLVLADGNETIAKNIAYFLQNIDKDSNISNGITIANNITNITNIEVNFTNETTINIALTDLGLKPKITPEEALKNLKDYISSINTASNQTTQNADNLSNSQTPVSNNSGYTPPTTTKPSTANKTILVVDKPYVNLEVNLSTVKTIKCDNLPIDSNFTINGETYDVVDNDSIKNREDYVHICTSHVTNMYALFSWNETFNQPIGKWDTSSVTNMDSMFNKAEQFNQPIADWNTSHVVTMSSMFQGAINFNQPIDSWDVSRVTKIDYMFSGAKSFNQPLNSWNTSNVVRMVAVFMDAVKFNQPIGNWDTSHVVTMASMFAGASNFDQAIGDWNTSNVTDMEWMFYNAANFNHDISKWCVSLIPEKPSNFDVGALLLQAHPEFEPKWGTCPTK